MGLKVRSFKLKDRDFGNQWFDKIEDHWDYEDFIEDESWRKQWISFDCLCYVPQVNTVYAGITSFDENNIFWGWDISNEQWVSTGYERIAKPFDAKFHRSLVYHKGHLWAAVAQLHNIDKYGEAPGSPIIRYNPGNNDIERSPAVLPRHYIQAIALDPEREIIYGITLSPEKLISYDINSGETKDIGPTGSAIDLAQGENIELDDEGNVWGGWTVMRAWQSSAGVDKNRLFRYSPKTGKIEYLKTGLPHPDGSYGYVKYEGLFNLGTGCLYASGGNGSIYRIDTKTGRAEYLFTPIEKRRSRLAAMTLTKDGFAYGVTGRDGKCELLRFDPGTEKYKLLGDIVDEQGTACWQVHHIIALPDGTLYAGENDNPYRSSYLWEIRLV
ncbi:MAG: hypothetical protein ABIG61_16470 [Planctomycetota bacterium]